MKARTHKCKRCGKCCREEVCLVGIKVYKDDKPPCKGLKRKGTIYACELMDIVSEEKQAFLFLLMGVGIG